MSIIWKPVRSRKILTVFGPCVATSWMYQETSQIHLIVCCYKFKLVRVYSNTNANGMVCCLYWEKKNMSIIAAFLFLPQTLFVPTRLHSFSTTRSLNFPLELEAGRRTVQYCISYFILELKKTFKFQPTLEWLGGLQ